ncbi:MAG TPA: hypothetical protein VK178_05095 [Opitutaceae bacterium]|nr:hypothetical protein [Opitutaceae bacterium]
MRETITDVIGAELNFACRVVIHWNGRDSCLFIAARAEFLGSPHVPK